MNVDTTPVDGAQSLREDLKQILAAFRSQDAENAVTEDALLAYSIERVERAVDERVDARVDARANARIDAWVTAHLAARITSTVDARVDERLSVAFDKKVEELARKAGGRRWSSTATIAASLGFAIPLMAIAGGIAGIVGILATLLAILAVNLLAAFRP